ncbi:hypothetical protein HKD37_12G034050 [Glycine soja]
MAFPVQVCKIGSGCWVPSKSIGFGCIIPGHMYEHSNNEICPVRPPGPSSIDQVKSGFITLVWTLQVKVPTTREIQGQVQEKEKSQSTWEDLDDTTFDEGEKKANLCMMDDTTSKQSKSEQELQKLVKKCKNLSKDHTELNKIHQYKDISSLTETTQNKCENHKNFVEFLNDKLLKNEILKGQPQDIVKCNEEIGTLKTTLAKFVGGIENLDKLLRYGRCSTNKSSHGYEREIYVYDEHTVVCYFCVKVGHMTSRCMDLP